MIFKRVVLVFFFTYYCFNCLNAQNLLLGWIKGTPLWVNKGGEYIKSDFGGLILRAYFPVKGKHFQIGALASFHSHEANENKILSSINQTSDFIEKTSAYYTSYRLGPALTFEKKWKRFGFLYGISAGLNLAYKTSFEYKFTPFDTISAGYSLERARFYSNGVFNTYGYYIMPTVDIYYTILKGENSKEIDFDLIFHLGVNLYYSKSISNNVYESQNNRQVEPNIIKYKEHPEAIGTSLVFGILYNGF